jgi:hypothetical protein
LLLRCILLFLRLLLLLLLTAARTRGNPADYRARRGAFAAPAADTAYQSTYHCASYRTLRAGTRRRACRLRRRWRTRLLSRRIGRIVSGLLDRPLMTFEFVLLLLLRALTSRGIHEILLRQRRRAGEKCGNRRRD